MRFLTILILLVFILLFAFFTQGGQTGRPCGERYIIQEGDTLPDIAARCGVSLDRLLAWNPQIDGPEDVRVGAILSLPPADANATVVVVEPGTFAETPATSPLVIVPQPTSAVVIPVTGEEPSAAPPVQLDMPAPQPQPQSVVAAGGTTVYTVQQCDTLYSIASAYGTTVAAVQAINPQITNPNLIHPGQQITIPTS